jgi:hypothetical protein
VLFIDARFDELSSDQYGDLCYAIESEVGRRRSVVRSEAPFRENEDARQARPLPIAAEVALSCCLVRARCGVPAISALALHVLCVACLPARGDGRHGDGGGVS